MFKIQATVNGKEVNFKVQSGMIGGHICDCLRALPDKQCTKYVVTNDENGVVEEIWTESDVCRVNLDTVVDGENFNVYGPSIVLSNFVGLLRQTSNTVDEIHVKGEGAMTALDERY